MSALRSMEPRRPDDTRLCSTLLMASPPESCLFRLIINNLIFCLIKTAINKKGTHESNLSPKMPHRTSSLEIFFHNNNIIIIIIIKLF
jgi:hypothetical protein